MGGPREHSAGTFGTSVRIMPHDECFLGNRTPSSFKRATGKFEEEVITDLYSTDNESMLTVNHDQLRAPGPNKVVMVIEHCSDCSKHPGTTRHDEGKYSNNAESIKGDVNDAYPFVEVHIKPTNSLKLEEGPLRPGAQPGWVREKGSDVGSGHISERHPQGFKPIDPSSYRSERLGASRELLSYRLGACEVTLAIQKPKDDVPKVHLLHSKLATKKWPAGKHVIARIADLLPTETRVVRVKCFDYSNMEIMSREIPAGVTLEARAGKISRAVDVPSGPFIRVGATDEKDADGKLVNEGTSELVTEGAVVRLEVPMCATSIDFAGSDLLCAGSVAIGPTAAEGEETLVELNCKPRLNLSLRLPAEGGFGGAGSLIVTKDGFTAELPFTEADGAWDVPGIPGAEPPAESDFACTIRLGTMDAMAFEKVVPLTLCQFGLTKRAVELPPIVAVTFVFEHDDSNAPLDLSKGSVKVELAGGSNPNENLADLCKAIEAGKLGTKLPPGDAENAPFNFYLPASGQYKVTACYPEMFDCETHFSTTTGVQKAVVVRMRPKTYRAVGRATLAIDVLPDAMLSSEPAKRLAAEGLLDVAIVVDLTATMNPAAKELAKVLGAGGAVCEIQKALEEEMDLVSSLHVAIIIYKDHNDPIPQSEPKAGCVTLYPLGPVTDKLGAAAQKLDAAGGGDSVYDAAGAALDMASKIEWRPAAARVLLLLTDGPPHGPPATGFEASKDDAFPKGAPDEWLDQYNTWPNLCARLAESSVAASAALLEGTTADDYHNSAVLAMGELAGASALGLVGKMKRGRDEPKLFAILAATAEVAMDQLILAETLMGPEYAADLRALSAGAQDEDAAVSAIIKACRALAAKLEAAKFVVREAEMYGPESSDPAQPGQSVQVVRRKITAVHTWEAVKAAIVQKRFTLGGLEGKVLLGTPNAAIVALYDKVVRAEFAAM